MRIHIIGTAGSGKTTLAKELTHKLGIPHIELDAHYWQPQWRHRSIADFRRQWVTQIASEAWVVDGEYSEVNRQIWDEAELVIWLDYPLALVLARILRRGVTLALTRHNLWESGNRETLRQLFGSRSLVHRARRTHHLRRQVYAKVMEDPRFAQGKFLRFVSPKAVEQWLHTMSTR